MNTFIFATLTNCIRKCMTIKKVMKCIFFSLASLLQYASV